MPDYIRAEDFNKAVTAIKQGLDALSKLTVVTVADPVPDPNPVPLPRPTPQPPTPTPVLAAKYPADILDLKAWKITLPTDNAKEILQPQLATYSDENFRVESGQVIFTASCGASMTDNSKYPRSELREMQADGKTRASWDLSKGTHVMTLTGSCLVLPPKKPQVVIAQIHNSSDDLLEILADGLAIPGKVVIAIRWKGSEDSKYLDNDYKLGEMYDLTVTGSGGNIAVDYRKGTTATRVTKAITSSGCYFKAGCYTQSNTSKGDAPTAFGRTTLTALKVLHT